MNPRPCGCKGCRTCLVCETKYGAETFKLQLELDKDKGYVYCPFCNKAWKGWDINLYKEHPHHAGESFEYPGVYIMLDFITENEEAELMKNIDDIPWDTSQSGRRKQNYGPKTNFKKKKVVSGSFDGFPECTKFIQDRFQKIELLKGYQAIEQCSLEYDPSKGASIDPHIDDCWIWGERIITVNCLADTVLTMTRYKGEIKKYNLTCAAAYNPIVNDDGSITVEYRDSVLSSLEACKPVNDLDVIVRIPMIRRSLFLMYGEPRYHWEHCILREDITTRRVCIAYREFTPFYMTNGIDEQTGEEIRKKANHFWDHRIKRSVQVYIHKSIQPFEIHVQKRQRN